MDRLRISHLRYPFQKQVSLAPIFSNNQVPPKLFRRTIGFV